MNEKTNNDGWGSSGLLWVHGLYLRTQLGLKRSHSTCLPQYAVITALETNKHMSYTSKNAQLVKDQMGKPVVT
jgi:hypothetical protein